MKNGELWRLISPETVDLKMNGLHHLSIGLAFKNDGHPETIRFPLVLARRGPGPIVLIFGGTHGDEFEGQIAVSNLCREIDLGKVHGTIGLVPFHNVAACQAGTRLTPGDNSDLNRLYGVQGGEGPAHTIARFVESVLLPQADWVVDLHSGGAAHEFVPSSNLQASTNSIELASMLDALLASDAPYAIVFDEVPGTGPMPHAGTLEGLARALGKKAISSELGGGARITPTSRHVAEHGLRNLLAYIGVMTSADAKRPEQSRSQLLLLNRPEHYVAAKSSGRFVPAVWLGEEVQEGDVLGVINPLLDPAAPPEPILSSCAGIVAAVASRGLQQANNLMFYVAEKLDRESARTIGW